TTTKGTPNTTRLTTALSSTLSYTFASAPDPSAFTPTANGDYVMVTTINSGLGGWNGTVRICPLPLTASCTLGAPGSASDGLIDVRVVYTFRFNPLFENRLSGVIDASVTRPFSVLQTSTRTYVE